MAEYQIVQINGDGLNFIKIRGRVTSDKIKKAMIKCMEDLDKSVMDTEGVKTNYADLRFIHVGQTGSVWVFELDGIEYPESELWAFQSMPADQLSKTSELTYIRKINQRVK